MGFTQPSTTTRDAAGNDSAAVAPSMTTSLEHLVSGSQGVFNNRIDLALLEARESLARSAEKAALVALAMSLAVAAWFAATAALVIAAAPDSGIAVRLAAFGALNAVGAAVLLAVSLRRGQPVPPEHRPDNPAETRREASPTRERN